MAEFSKQLDSKVARRINEELYQPLIKCGELSNRVHKEPVESRPREPYQRDYTRIMYSSAFRRLQGKMQLLWIDNTNFTRNRLTHSLEVSQIARSIANDIEYNQNDIYVVEACSLAHDIGNPPFGHRGEKILNDIIINKVNEINNKEIKKNSKAKIISMEGFEGNAQTLRVLTQLQTKYGDYPGMNLTYRTLLGVVKYFNSYQENQKKFLYEEDYNTISELIKKYDLPKRTLDVQLMDLADEIAYAAHDIEDTLRNRHFTIEEFIQEFKTNEDLIKEYTQSKVDEAVENLIDYVDKAIKKIQTRTGQFHSLFCKELGSKIIYELIRDIDINDSGELHFKTKKVLAKGLKLITFVCLCRSNEVKFYEEKGSIILNGLFDFYFEKPEFLPYEYSKLIEKGDEVGKIRNVVDYISGMMDTFAIDNYEKIYGNKHFETFGLIRNEWGI